MRLKKISFIVFIPCLIVTTGCMRVALRLSPDVYDNFNRSYFEECDTTFARNSIPANLKMLEGILKSDPQNRFILAALSAGFCGYSMLFVEHEDPERASKMYLRSRDFGIRSLGQKADVLLIQDRKITAKKIHEIGTDDFEAFFWMTVAWISWINLNLDKPSALAQLGNAEECLERILEINPEYLYGLPYILKGIMLAVRSPMLGGDLNRAAGYFQKALKLSDRSFLMAHYYYARYYAVGVQNRDLFKSLIDEAAANDPTLLKDICLINSVIHNDFIPRLRESIDDFFF